MAKDPLIEVWPQMVPGELLPEVRQHADAAVDGVVMFRFHGFHPIQVGHTHIDWAGGHRKHQEWPAQLNRFHMLRPLASAWHHTRDVKYAEAARDYIEDWLEARPTREDWRMGAGDNTLTLSIRVGNSVFPGWGGLALAFEESGVFSPALISRIKDSIRVQLNYLAANLTKHGNWRISQADTLVTTAVRFPDLEGAKKWSELGVRVLNEAALEQYLPDGAHIERTPGYHGWMTRVLLNYWMMGQAHPDLGLEISTGQIQRCYQYYLASFRPNGMLNQLHDTQAEGSLSAIERQYQDFLERAGLKAAPKEPQYFPHAGQVLMRDKKGRDAGYVTFDATPYSLGHWHLGTNSIQVDVKGEPILVDAGILDYERSNPLAAHGKGTRAHNTISLNGWNQAPCSAIPLTYDGGETYDYVQSTYTGGYWPSPYAWTYRDGAKDGIWGQHERSLLWLHDKYLLVADVITHRAFGEDAPIAEVNWQFRPGQLELDAANHRAHTAGEGANLLLQVVYQPAGGSLEVNTGAKDPLRGWVATPKGVEAAPQVTLESKKLGDTSVRFVTLLLPFEGQDVPRPQVSSVPGTHGRVTKVEYGGKTDYVFLSPAIFTATVEGIRFYGTAGVVSLGGAEPEIVLPAPGYVEVNGKRVKR